MSDPFDLEPLAPELQGLLDAERGAPAAPMDAKARLLARLEHSLFDVGGDGGGPDGDGGAVGGGPGDAGGDLPDVGGGFEARAAAAKTAAGGTVAAKAAAGTAAAGASIKTAAVTTLAVAKLTIGVGVTSFVAGGAVGAGMHAAMTSPQAETEIVAARPAPPSPPALPAELTSPVEEAPPPVVAEPAPVHEEPSPVPAEAPPVRRPLRVERAVAATQDALEAERSFVEQSRSALARGDAAAAITALGEHRRKFPAGRLAEERDALEIQALVALGRMEEAQTHAATFRKNYPTSLLRPAIDALVP